MQLLCRLHSGVHRGEARSKAVGSQARTHQTPPRGRRAAQRRGSSAGCVTWLRCAHQQVRSVARLSTHGRQARPAAAERACTGLAASAIASWPRAMRRLACVAGGRLLAAAAAAPLDSASGRAALAAGTIWGEHATRGASAASSRAFAASSRALSTSGAPADKGGEDGEPQQPTTAAAAGEPEPRPARTFRSFRSREGRPLPVINPPRVPNKSAPGVTKKLPMNLKLSAIIAGARRAGAPAA